MKLKTLAIFAPLIVVFAMMLIVAAPVHAEDQQSGTIIARGTCGDNASWTLSDTDELVISGTGKVIYGGWDRKSVITMVSGYDKKYK